MPSRRRATLVPALLLAGICLLLFGFRLSETGFRGLYDDVDRALISRQMADSGDWLVPVYHGKPIYTKPPLTYWLAGGLYALTGRHDELPAAAVSVLCMTWTVLATWLAGRILLGRRAAFMAGLILPTSYLFLTMSRQPLIDTVMMAGFALAFLALVNLGFREQRRTSWWCLLAVGIGATLMTKGPVMIPLLAIMGIPLWTERPRLRPSAVQAILATALLLAIVVPWHVLLFRHSPESWEVWKVELLGRFGDGRQFHEWTQKPLWFYIPDMIHFAPWILILPAGIAHAVSRRGERRFRLLLWWAVGGFLYFTLASATKRSYYLLPLYPALALLCAAVWNFVAAGRPAPGRWTGRLFRAGAWLFMLAVLGLGVAAVGLPGRMDFADRWPFLRTGVVTVTLAMVAIGMARRGRWRPAFGWSSAGVAMALLLYVGDIVPPMHEYLSGREFYGRAARLIPPGGRLAVNNAHRSLTAFYLRRQDVRVLDGKGVGRWLADGRGGHVIGDPQHLEGREGLEELLTVTLRSPAGDERRLGLYRLRESPRPDPADRPESAARAGDGAAR